MKMIEKMLPFQFIKRSPFYGSYEGMHYRITEMHGELEVIVWPGPYALSHTADEKKIVKTFSYDEEGYNASIQYLNEVFRDDIWRDKENSK